MKSYLSLLRLLAATILVACAAIAAALRAESAPIVIGVLASEAPSDEVLALARGRVSDWNARGGSQGRSVRVTSLTTHGDPDAAAAAAVRLLRDEGVVAILLACTPEETSSVARALGSSAALLMSVQPTHEWNADDGVLRLAGGLVQRCASAIAFVVRASGPRVAVLTDDTPRGRLHRVIVRDICERLGCAIVVDQVEARGVQIRSNERSDETSTLVDRLGQTNATLVISSLSPDATRVIARAVRRSGFDAGELPMLHLGVEQAGLSRSAREELKGDLILSSAAATRGASARRFIAAQSGHQQSLTEAGELTVVAMGFLEQLFERTDIDDRAGLLAAMAGRSIAAPSHVLTIDREQLMPWMHAAIGRIASDGQLVEVWRDEEPSRPRHWPIWRSTSAWRAIARGDELPTRSASAKDHHDQ